MHFLRNISCGWLVYVYGWIVLCAFVLTNINVWKHTWPSSAVLKMALVKGLEVQAIVE